MSDDHGYGANFQRLISRCVFASINWTISYLIRLTNLIQAPYRFHGLYAIGCIFFLLNIVLFIFNVTMISLRFRYHPATFKASIRHPTESLFVPAAVISMGTILTNISEYGYHYGATGPWLMDVMVVLFWVYCGLALSFTCGIYLILWVVSSHQLNIHPDNSADGQLKPSPYQK